MACFPVGTRKKRWHTAGSFSTAFNIFQNSEAKPVRKSWWSFTKRISVNVKPVEEIFIHYRFEDAICWLEWRNLNTEKQPPERRLIKCTLHSIRQVTILNIWWNQFPMHRFFGKIKKKEIASLHTVSSGVTRFCSIGKNRCAVQRKGQLSIDGKLFFSLSWHRLFTYQFVCFMLYTV